MYSDKRTPSCNDCDSKRLKMILQNKHANRLPKCNQCTDWQYDIETTDCHPINLSNIDERLSDDKDSNPVQLSFKLLHRSLERLQNDLRDVASKPPTKKGTTSTTTP